MEVRTMPAMFMFLYPLFITLSWAFMIAGIILPFIYIETFYVLTETPSILEIIAGLIREGDYFLTLILLLFTLVFPVIKLTLLTLAIMPASNNALGPFLMRAILTISKWSMLDIMVLALVIYSLKANVLTSALTQPGAWCFAASIILSSLISLTFKPYEKNDSPNNTS